MNRPVSVGLLIAVLVIVSIAGVSGPILAAGGGGAGSNTQNTVSAEPSALQGTALQTNDIGSGDFDRTVFEITVHENGSATWTFRHERQLDGDSEGATRESFEEFAAEFESTETELYQLFTEQAQAMVDSGAEATGREMAATNFNRSARVSGQLNPSGIVEMSFTWEGFAAVDGERIVVGDVFRSLYLTDDQSIVVEPDDGLRFEQIEPEGETFGASVEEADSVTWYGEQEFFAGHPRIVFTHADGATAEGSSSTLNGAGDLSWPVVAAGFVVLLAVGSGAVWYRRQGDAPLGGIGTADDAVSSAPASETAAETATETGGTAAAASSPQNAPSAADSSDAAEDQESSTDSEPLSDEELLTDEDRVVKLIRENGGRMKQVNIVEETGWSKSKVSMLLSDMEEEGTISKLRVGRENIISLDGFEPEATKSPFDEQ